MYFFAQIHKTSTARVPYNKLLTNLASSVLGNIGPRSFLYGFCTATTSGQYSPVRPSRSISKRLVIYLVLHDGERKIERLKLYTYFKGYECIVNQVTLFLNISGLCPSSVECPITNIPLMKGSVPKRRDIC